MGRYPYCILREKYLATVWVSPYVNQARWLVSGAIRSRALLRCTITTGKQPIDGPSMQVQPSDTLKSATFIGLLLAQFLAAFNDQAIHASAMFFAIHRQTLSEANAISLMPILFYAPWALFCTIAGYLADRYSKRQSLVFWKFAEIGITLVALAGFWLGSVQGHWLGPVLVLSTVFLMGTHSAFFVPAKYGAMPQILQPHLLSKGNGWLESLSFLAVILGTVSGGMLSHWFRDQEYRIGIILVVLAVIGAAASLLIKKLPAANPMRPFPTNLFKPLFANLQTLLRSRPLALAVLAIAFFTFMVAFMRGTMYMHGETRNPRWDELHTSIIVGVVALGVGLGSPLAGFLSEGKVELGLVPLGAVGMILSLVLVAFTLDNETALVGCLIGIGFFTGFYIVPMFTLLQHRAPRASKGDLLATSNFVNVIGAISASVLFKGLVLLAAWVGITPSVQPEIVAHGTLLRLDNFSRPSYPSSLEVRREDGTIFRRSSRQVQRDDQGPVDRAIIEAEGYLQPATDEQKGTEVIVGSYALMRQGHRVRYYKVLQAGEPLEAVQNKEPLTRALFLVAALMTLGILVLLCRLLPDFFVRSLLWMRAQGRSRLKVIGLQNLPTEGPVLLATNCDRFKDCMQVVTATDRFTRFILLEDPGDREPTPLLRYLARRTGLVALRPDTAGPEEWDKALTRAVRALDEGKLVAVTADGTGPQFEKEQFLEKLRARAAVPILPVYCGTLAADPEANGRFFKLKRVRVVIGQPVRPAATAVEIRRAIHDLGEWVHETEQAGTTAATSRIQAAVNALPSRTVPNRPEHP
jgi:MFS family permease/1-acyl-sn-glycerol-3-phosphate acyltransferase